MPLPSPNLDDRTFDDLVRSARELIAQNAPTWTDLSVGDPGMALVEAFAYLADTTIYRLNRVPDKLYVEFLRLIGVRIQPPTAATTDLRFSREHGDNSPDLEIPRGTRATLGGSSLGVEPPIFATLQRVVIPAGQDSVVARAIHAELVEGELLGRASGAPGAWFTARRPPIIAASGDPLDLVLAVEALPDELSGTDAAIEFDGRSFRIWSEVEDFADLGPDREVYIADRTAGTIILAPAVHRLDVDGRLETGTQALGAVPPMGREVRAWYRRGGGPSGNVAANTITSLRDPLPGVKVTNEAAATGGRAAESLENALVRGPQDLHSLSRAVTARDYQLVAERSSGAISRAHAFTQAAVWSYATPGTVEVVLVPALPDTARGASVTADQLIGLQTVEATDQVQRAIDARRPLGTRCVVGWARYKTVHVRATIVVQREEDVDAVRRRVDERLHLTVNPLPSARSADGWPFGQALYASNVYKIILSEPGVRYARGVRLTVDEVPAVDVKAIEADPHQPSTWYAGSGSTLFRSLNDGDGWEPMGRFPDSHVTVARIHPSTAGLLAVVTVPTGGIGSSVWVSPDSGETWPFRRGFGFLVEDVAWMTRDGEPLLLLAAGDGNPNDPANDGGLYQLAVTPGAAPVQILVEPANAALPLYAVSTFLDVRGITSVAVAAQGRAGVYISKLGGVSNSFTNSGLVNEDVRVLAVQRDGPRAFLWAGAAAPGGPVTGRGCHRRELLGMDDPVGGWQDFNAKWEAGSCWALGFDGNIVVAATQQFGVLRLDADAATPAWVAPDVDSGLPMRDKQRFHPVEALAVAPGGGRTLAGGPVGVYRSVAATSPPSAASPSYETCSSADFSEQVTLPSTWLLVCGDNALEVQTDAAG